MRNGQATGLILLLTLLVAAAGVACGSEQPSRQSEGKIALIDDSGSLLLIGADGSGKTVIPPVPPDSFTDFTWSGDSKKIAFVRDDPHRSDYYPAIFVVRAAGGEPRMLVDGEDPSWSPDGRTIAFVRDDYLRLINGDGTDERRLARVGGHLALLVGGGDQGLLWSSDSQKIAYATSFLKDTQLCRVHIVPTNGRPEVEVTSGFTQCDIAWSADGTRIAFTRKGLIYSVEADGTHEQRLARGLEPSWSPDGSHLAYLRNGSIYTLDIASHAEHRLVRGEDLSWSPDGAFLLVRREIKQRAEGVPGKFVVETMRPDGSERRPLWPQGGGSCDCGDYPAWQPG